MKVRCKPRDAQVQGGSFLIQRPAGCLAFATGTGKTLVEILVAFRKINDKRVDKFFFVGTLSSLIEIQQDFLTFTDTQPMVVETIDQMRVFVQSMVPVCVMQWNWVERMIFLDPNPKDQAKASELNKRAFKKQAWTMEETQWMNKHNMRMEGIIRERKERIADILSNCRHGWNLDEFHMIKNPVSSVRMAFDFIRPYMYCVYGYTATAIMANVYDLYWLINFLDPKILGSEDQFNAHYVDREREHRGRRLGWKVKGFRNLTLLNEVLKPVMMTYFPTRAITWNMAGAELPEENAAEYLEAAMGVFAKEEDPESGKIKQHSARLNDLQYVVNNIWAKQRAFLIDVREKLSQGVIVFCAFYETHSMLQKLLDRFKVPHNSITGKQDTDGRREAKDWFNSNPEGKVLLITRAGGQSLNLHSTPNLSFYDTPFGIGYFMQTIGRVVRDFGKFDKFNITFIILKGTIDEYKYELVTSQRELFVKVFNNEALPSSPEFEQFSSKVVERLRRELLWKTSSRRKSKV